MSEDEKHPRNVTLISIQALLFNANRNPVAGISDGDVNMGRSGKKVKTPVSEQVSMARTTRNAATKSKL